MGVAGAGKSTVGAALARALGVEFVEGDGYHPQANRNRMAAGIPLTDEDRAGWLQALAARLRHAHANGEGVVLACSALKRAYRDVLRDGGGVLRYIFLDGDRSMLAERLVSRQGHFMPASLLDSQLATLQRPAADEGAWTYDAAHAPDEIVRDVVARITREAEAARGTA
jgi:gluconokinase